MVMSVEAKSANRTPARREGPKRSESSRQAILVAARDELSENGWRNFSPDRLSKRAKASKQTIYRWWPSVATIAVEAAIEIVPKPKIPEKVELDVGLRALLEPFAETARAGDGAHILRSALLAAADDAPAGEAFRQWFNTEYRKPMKAMLAEAAVRGKIRRDWDIDAAAEMLFGPLWHRLVLMRGPLPEVVIIRASQAVSSALRP